jgi:hypothetical protein
MMTMADIRRLANAVGMERLLVVAAVVSGITVLVLLFGTLLVGLWAGVVGAVLVLAAFYLAMQRTLQRLPGGGSSVNSTPTVRIDINKLQGNERAYVQRALERRASIEQAVEAAGDPGVKRALLDATRDLPELVQTIYELALKSQSVGAGLRSSGSMNSLIQDTQRLDALIETTTDEFQRNQYRSTMDGNLQQMQNMTDTEVALKRWDAQLENALGTLDTILSQVLRVSSSQVLSYTGDTTDDLSSVLRKEVDELKATSDAFDSVYGSVR